MLIAIPLGFENARRAVPVVSSLVALAAMLLFLLAWILPADVERSGTAAWLAAIPTWLDADPGAVWRGQIHRLWTAALCHGQPEGLILGLLGWAALAFSCERHIGKLRFLVLMLILAPLTRILPVWWQTVGPDNGLVLIAAGLAGALFHLRPRLELDAACLLYLVVQIRVRRFRLPAKALLIGLIITDLLRLALRYREATDGFDRSYLQVTVLSYLVVLVGGYFAAALLSRRRPAPPPDALHELAAGEGDLDDLDGILRRCPAGTAELLDRIADRIIAEEHLRAGRRLAAWLAQREPESPTRRRLIDRFGEERHAGDDQRPTT